ncbi:MAG: glycosyltransferase [Clostridiaceae bacterium]|nr:glycosyltransferase [Clostridiaceae bacterium]
MKILFFLSNKFMQNDMIQALTSLKHEIDTFAYTFRNYEKDDFLAEKLEKKLKRSSYDAVFSMNYYPVISDVCAVCNTLYISWVYDSPAPSFLRFDQPTNRIFLFDHSECRSYRAQGYTNIMHLPLAVNAGRIDSLLSPMTERPDYIHDISFVGGLYNNYALNTLHLTESDYVLGLLQGFAAAQTQLQNVNILDTLLQSGAVTFDSSSYEDMRRHMLAETTHRERHLVLNYLAKQFCVDLYTSEPIRYETNIRVHGSVHYEKVMPRIFRNSRINLNLTLRSIVSGIPLRVFDIMASGGFVVTTPQEELFDYFEPDVDFVYYTSHQELAEKCRYYLNHENERFAICQSAYQKIKESHTLTHRLQELFSML